LPKNNEKSVKITPIFVGLLSKCFTNNQLSCIILLLNE
jgi:hypothetical protein